MKILTINYSGNLGKTTISRHLLAPRLNGCRVLPVETVNSDGTDEKAVRGQEFPAIARAVRLTKEIVVDVGASNAESFLHGMHEEEGSWEDYDYIIVPTVARTKQLRDTIATVDTLHQIGVPPAKIRLVFNMISAAIGETVTAQFEGLFNYAGDKGRCIANPAASIRMSELFPRLRTGRKDGEEISIASLIAEGDRYKEQLKTAETPELQEDLSDKIGLARMAKGMQAHLDSAFAALIAEPEVHRGRAAARR